MIHCYGWGSGNSEAGQISVKKLAKLSALAMIASVLAVSCTASALAAGEFEAEGYPAAIAGEGTGEQALALPGEAEVKCKKAGFSGELAKPAETLTVLPSYTECSAFGTAATVAWNGCGLVYRPEEASGEIALTGKAEVSCPNEKQVVIVAFLGLCEVRIGSQSALSSATYTDILSPEPATVTTELKLTAVHANVTKDGPFCPLAGVGERTNGTLTGTSLAKASVEGEAVGMAALVSKNTRLCEAAQANNVCPDAKTFPAKTAIATVAKPPKSFNRIYIEIGVTKNEQKEKVRCEEGTFFLRSKEKEGKPLKVEGVALAFASCKTELKETACTVKQVGGSAEGELRASRLKPGYGYLRIPLTLRVECGKEINCEYVHPWYGLWLSGGSPGVMYDIYPQAATMIKYFEGEIGCSERARWRGGYNIQEPAAVWVNFSK